MRTPVVRAFLLAALVCVASSGVAQTAPAGSAVIVGTVVRKDNNAGLGYSVISAPTLARELFSDPQGAFTVRDLPAGELRLRIKHIGFSPRDTVVTLRDNDTLRIRIVLTTLVVQLPARP